MGQLFDGILPTQGRGSVRLGLGIDQCDRKVTAGVFGALPGLVGQEPLLNVGGNTGVERTVTAGEYIDVVHGAPPKGKAPESRRFCGNQKS